VKAGERDEFLRAAWRVMVAEGIDARDFVFVDECRTHTSLAPIYGYSPRGERVYSEVPRNRGPNTTLLVSMSVEGMEECLVVEGATTKVFFEAYVERVLAPSLPTGQVVMMDNLSAHKGERVRELIEARDCKFLYLPPYLPDYNPIEGHSPRSRPFCARPQPAHARRSSKRWGRRSQRSVPRMLLVSSSIVAIVPRFSFYETRCSMGLRPFFMPLFTQVPRRGLLGSPYAGSCIDLPREARGDRVRASGSECRRNNMYRSWIKMQNNARCLASL
jgi:transposase